MIDRQARTQLAAAIRTYMNDELMAFEFDEAIFLASRGSSDTTVQNIAQELWSFYDDYKDHKIIASKVEWDYFNRVLLLLESDAEMETVGSWSDWHPLQAIAAFLLIVFILTTYREGFGEHLIGFALPFGPPSMLLAWLNLLRDRRNLKPETASLYPFQTLGQILRIRRRNHTFQKIPYPGGLADRRIRSPLIQGLIWVNVLFAWCMLAPVGLFFQMLPGKVWELSIKDNASPPATPEALPV